ncbi:hypothetical protein HNY73_023233 [Argiope bruennichi]|uniref:Uncharacterized protein n=1 Tax=Argiope bruennichi TaxID=94029 RepID=A0A8T0E5X6_ARGBR|nr:hypothetical protein HNY73_023233 [Argiope bruennichi]
MALLKNLKKDELVLVAEELGLELTSAEQWHHVPSSQNPADLISRGLDPSSLHHSSLWWTGPPFLSTEDMSSSEPSPVSSIEDFQSEFKTNQRVIQHELERFKCSDSNNFVYLNAKVNNFVHDILGLSNNYGRLIRILSYIYRFLNNCRVNFPKNFGILKAIELKESEMRLLKIVQEEDLHKEIKSLKASGFVNTDSQVKNLFPFLDENGILRIGGRFTHSDLDFDSYARDSPDSALFGGGVPLRHLFLLPGGRLEEDLRRPPSHRHPDPPAERHRQQPVQNHHGHGDGICHPQPRYQQVPQDCPETSEGIKGKP